MSGGGRELEALVDRVYDVAVAPERLEQLIDIWTERLNGARGAEPLQLLAEPGVYDHVERAERVLRELIAVSGEERDSAREWTEDARGAAFVVNRSAIVVSANRTARDTLGITPGNALSVLPVAPDDLGLLTELIRNVDVPGNRDVRLLRLRQENEATSILVRIVESIGGDPDQIGLVTSVLCWPPQLADELRAAFQLTDAECAVLKEVTIGYSVKEIAERSRRSEPTIRSHISALLAKTGARTQLELVRVTLGLFDTVEQAGMIAPLRAPPGLTPEPNHYNTLKLADGRRLDFLVIGDGGGRPFLMLPTDMGFTRLPPPAEAWLARNRMRMIVPVRAGYGGSSPIPIRRDAFDVHIEDMLALADHLGVDRFPLLAMCDDFHLAVATACLAPSRITAIVAVGPIMPASNPEHYRRMNKWSRFVFANVRYAPRTLPFVTMAFFQCIRRLGPRRFLQAVLAESKADQKVVADDETLTALLRGSEIAIGPRFTAHVAWAKGAIANHAADWSEKLKSCPVPMIVYAGGEDPVAPIETTREVAATVPRMTLREFPEYGQLLYPLWPQFLRDVQRALAN